MSAKPLSEVSGAIESSPPGFKVPKWLMGSSAGTGIGAILLGAITWANSIATTMTRIETKLDDMKERVRRLEDHQFGGPGPRASRRESEPETRRDDG